MPAFLKNKWLWIGLVLIVLLVGGFVAFSKAGAAKKAQQEKEASQKIDSPYAAIANGKADVEGGVIKVAARRGGGQTLAQLDQGSGHIGQADGRLAVSQKDRVLRRHRHDHQADGDRLVSQAGRSRRQRQQNALERQNAAA